MNVHLNSLSRSSRRRCIRCRGLLRTQAGSQQEIQERDRNNFMLGTSARNFLRAESNRRDETFSNKRTISTLRALVRIM